VRLRLERNAVCGLCHCQHRCGVDCGRPEIAQRNETLGAQIEQLQAKRRVRTGRAERCCCGLDRLRVQTGPREIGDPRERRMSPLGAAGRGSVPCAIRGLPLDPGARGRLRLLARRR